MQISITQQRLFLKNKNIIIVAMIISLAALVLSSILLWFKIVLHSDILFLESLLSDLATGGNWTNWKLTPAPAYFPDMIMYAIAYGLGFDPKTSIFLVSVGQCYIFCITLVWLTYKIKPDASKITPILILFCVALFTYVIYKSDIWFYFYSTNNHYAAVIGGLICYGLYIKFINNKKIINIVLFYVFCVLFSISTPVFLINFMFPLVIYNVIQLLLVNKIGRNSEQKVEYNNILLRVIVLVSSVATTYLVNYFTLFNDPMAGRTSLSIDGAVNAFKNFLLATKSGFITNNNYVLGLSIFISLSLFSILFFVQRKIYKSRESKWVVVKISKSSLRMMNASIFVIISLIFNLIAVVASGGFVDWAGYRYLTFPLVAIVLLCIIWFDEEINLPIDKMAYLLIILNIIMIVYFTKAIFTKKENYAVESQAKLLANCIEQNVNIGNLRSGISDYWNSRGVEMQAVSKNKITAFHSDLSPFYWMSTIDTLRSPEKYNIFYNFIILNSDENPGPFGFSAKNIKAFVPKPDEIIACDKINAKLWIYKSDILNKIIQNSIDRFLQKDKSRTSYKSEAGFFPGVIGIAQESLRIADSKNDLPGFLIYGPYINISKGFYELEIVYESEGSFGSTFDGGYFKDQPHNSIFKIQLKNEGKNIEKIYFEIDESNFKNFEMRVWFSGRGRLKVHSLDLNQLN